MLDRAVLSGVAVLLGASMSGAQGVEIQHDPVGCIVAGKHPKLNACFSPASQLARRRVYFQAADTPHWYYVDMKSDAPCHMGILPKPKKIIQAMNYYLETTDSAFVVNRTAQNRARVVERENECRNDPPAAFLNNAPVTVGAVGAAPAVPFGFVGATAAISTPLLIAGGVAVAGGTTAALVLRGDETPTTTQTVTTLGPPATTPLPPPPPVTAPTPTVPAPDQVQPFNPVFQVNPVSGRDPLRVIQDMCLSTGLDLRFTFDFEADGVVDRRGADCRATRIYTLLGVTAPVAATTPSPAIYTTRLCAIDARGPRECRDFNLRVDPNTPFTVEALGQTPASRRLAWASDLDVEGGSAQVVANGEAASFAGHGRSTAVALGRRGGNRIEGVLVQSAGRPGTWRFDLSGTGSFERGSLRVVAGEVAEISGDAVVFRLKGKPGERVVFSFRTGK